MELPMRMENQKLWAKRLEVDCDKKGACKWYLTHPCSFSLRVIHVQSCVEFYGVCHLASPIFLHVVYL